MNWYDNRNDLRERDFLLLIPVDMLVKVLSVRSSTPDLTGKTLCIWNDYKGRTVRWLRK